MFIGRRLAVEIGRWWPGAGVPGLDRRWSTPARQFFGNVVRVSAGCRHTNQETVRRRQYLSTLKSVVIDFSRGAVGSGCQHLCRHSVT